MHRWVAAGLLATILAGAAGCGRTQEPALTVLAAASTRDAVQKIASEFTRETGIAVRLNADDSSKLASQIAAGAPADVFLSANEKWAAYLQDKGLVAELRPLLGNSLVIVVPKGNPARVAQPQDLAGAAVKKVAVAGPTVPAGIYAAQSLRHLHLWDELEKQKKLAIGENVRVTLTYVERGEAEAGIVYGTDARISDRVEPVYTFPPAAHDPIVYPLVLLKSAADRPEAKRFFDYLQSPAAFAVFQKHGFTRPPTE